MCRWTGGQSAFPAPPGCTNKTQRSHPPSRPADLGASVCGRQAVPRLEGPGGAVPGRAGARWWPSKTQSVTVLSLSLPGAGGRRRRSGRRSGSRRAGSCCSCNTTPSRRASTTPSSPTRSVCTTRRSLLCRICSPGRRTVPRSPLSPLWCEPPVCTVATDRRPHQAGRPGPPAGLGRDAGPRGVGGPDSRGSWSAPHSAGRGEGLGPGPRGCTIRAPRPAPRPAPGPGLTKKRLTLLRPAPAPSGWAPVLYFVLLPKRVNNKSFGFFL